MFKNAHKDIGYYASRMDISKMNRRLRVLVNPKLNRWTGKPHKHEREIARRQVQEGNRLFRQDMREVNR